jgi:hypothetical protein
MIYGIHVCMQCLYHEFTHLKTYISIRYLENGVKLIYRMIGILNIKSATVKLSNYRTSYRGLKMYSTFEYGL